MNKDFLERTELLIGENSLDKLINSKVLVFGVGGVGGFVVEALARSGIGSISIVDFDTVDITNINRQIIALHSTVGMNKVDLIENRVKDINPSCNVIKYIEKLEEENIEIFNIKDYNYIVDAIDSVNSKLALAKYCYKNNINLISSMGTGHKLDPKRFQISDIKETNTCPLARVMRTKLKKLGVEKLKVLWSDEVPTGSRYIDPENKKLSPSSISFVPSVAGLIIAGEVIKDLIELGE